MNPDSLLGLWFMVSGEPMQVVDEALTTRGHHYVWLRGPCHRFSKRPDDVQLARSLTTPATREQVHQSMEKWASKLSEVME